MILNECRISAGQQTSKVDDARINSLAFFFFTFCAFSLIPNSPCTLARLESGNALNMKYTEKYIIDFDKPIQVNVKRYIHGLRHKKISFFSPVKDKHHFGRIIHNDKGEYIVTGFLLMMESG